jgi:3-deoxy-D-manno-octulosonate 8-phosphate phosphatase (KDO 8-P phosphatase)
MSFDPSRLAALQAIAFDVDGVLTDGSLTWRPDGEESKSFSFRDIMGVSLMRRLGLRLALISGEPSPLVDLYAAKMHIPFVAKGTRDKAGALRAFTAQFGVELEHTCFFGDDVNDLFAMEMAGMCACPANASAEVLAYVLPRAKAGTGYVAAKDGGHGAVRAFADALLQAHGVTGRDVFLRKPPE